MGKHSRTGPPPPPGDRPPRRERIDPGAADVLEPFHRRRQPPLDGPRIHRALHGGASHLSPDQPRLLFAWDGYGYAPAGTAPDLAAARAWAAEFSPEGELKPGST